MGLLYSNYECNPTNNLNINAVSGTLTKTFKESYFKRFQRDFKTEEAYFCEEPFRGRYNRNYGYWDTKTPIVVLQVMLMSNDYYVVEAIDKDIFDKYFETPNEENTEMPKE